MAWGLPAYPDPSCRGSTSTLRPRSRKPGRQNPRHDKTTVHELPNQYPTLDEELRAEKARPQALDRSSTGLKASHDFGTEQIPAGEAAHSTRPDGERCPGDGTRGATERLPAESQTSWT